MVRAPTWEGGKEPPHTAFTHIQLNTAAPQPITQRGDSRRRMGGYFHTQKQNQSFLQPHSGRKRGKFMAFFNSAVGVLQTLVVALGAGLGIWGVINLMEGYGNDNPGAKSQGMKQLMAGGGVALIGMVLVPLLSGLFTV